MADYSITAADVKPATSGYEEVTGEWKSDASITAGDILYLKTSATKIVAKADSNDTASTAVILGMAMNSCSSGQRVTIGKGNILVGSIGSLADPIVILSTTAGKVAPYGDLGTSQRVVIAGWFVAANEVKISPLSIGVTTPAP
jgi:hypothetical protein